MIGTLTAVYVVLVLAAEVSIDVRSIIEWDQRVGTRSVALAAFWDQLLACLTSELCQPVSLFARAGAIPVLYHMREDIITDITLAHSMLNAVNRLNVDSQEVTGALCTHGCARALIATCQVTLLALVLLEVVPFDAFSASEITT